jgi:hypothetical protein
MIFTYNGILLSHKDEILSFAGRWLELENILSKVSQAQKAKSPHVLPHIWIIDLKQM